MHLRTTKRTNRDGTVRQYLQLVRSERRPGKKNPTTVVVATLGRLDQLRDGEFDSLVSGLMKWSTLQSIDAQQELDLEGTVELGLRAMIDGIWRKLGLDRMLRDCGLSEAQQLSVKLMVVARLEEPLSKRATQKRAQRLVLPEEQVPSLDTFYRSLNALEAHMTHVENEMFRVAYGDLDQRDLFEDERLNVVFFDTTSIRIHRHKADGLFQRGYSKDHRPDLTQVVVGVVMSDAGDPICHYVFPGNTADSVAFREAVNDVCDRFPLRRVILVSDTGCVNEKLLTDFRRRRLEYIVGSRLRGTNHGQTILNARGVKGKWHKYDDNITFKEMDIRDDRYLLVRNEDLAAHDRQRRETVLHKLHEAEGRTLKSLARNRAYSRFLVPDGEIRIDEARVEADARYDGKWLLQTSVRDMSATDLLEGYKSLWRVERWFRCLKQQLDVAPMYHWTEPRVRAHIGVCFLAMKVWSFFTNALSVSHPDLGPLDVWREVSSVTGALVNAKGQRVFIRSNMSDAAVKAFQAARSRIPDRARLVGVTPQE